LESEIAEQCKRSEAIIAVEELHHLYSGGRLSGAGLFLGNLMKVKPILGLRKMCDEQYHTSKSGIFVRRKAMGSKKIAKTILEELRKFFSDADQKPNLVANLMFSGKDTKQKAEKLGKMIENEFHVKALPLVPIDHLVGSHTGDETWGLAFLNPKI
jgi:fatty acid-binding protein DegV